MSNPQSVDWSVIPAPQDDGAASHLPGADLPDISLPSTDGGAMRLSQLPGRCVLYVYPMTARPDRALPDDWDVIPGARGCTPQSCAFRDHHGELTKLGVNGIFGISAQSTEDQREAAERLHLPFPLLSDAALGLADALGLPRFEADGRTLLKRLTMITRDGRIEHVFYPVFPPDRNAEDVMEWLRGNPA